MIKLLQLLFPAAPLTGWCVWAWNLSSTILLFQLSKNKRNLWQASGRLGGNIIQWKKRLKSAQKELQLNQSENILRWHCNNMMLLQPLPSTHILIFWGIFVTFAIKINVKKVINESKKYFWTIRFYFYSPRSLLTRNWSQQQPAAAKCFVQWPLFNSNKI